MSDDRLVIIQNDPEVPPGNFDETIAGLNVPCRTVRPYAGEALPPAAEVAAAIVLGGAMGVHDTDSHPFLAQVKDFIGDCIRLETPLFGVCLGGQLLAGVLGGRVTINSPCRERGTLTVRLTAAGERDPLFTGIPPEFVTFQWHNDAFEIPAGATLLASSAACPGQAFRYGPCAWGTQFHPEVDRAIVDRWARWSKKTAPLADEFVAAFISEEQSYLEHSRRLLGNFLKLACLV